MFKNIATVSQQLTWSHYIELLKINDKNIKTINQEKAIGIIICKKDNKFVMEYCSDEEYLEQLI